MAKAKKMLSAVLAALMVVLSVASYVPAQAAKAVNVPKLQMVTQPEKEYKNGDRVSFTVTSPNYGGQVEYRVILWNGTTKTQSELWPTHKGYYYQNWKPAGSYKFTIHWPVDGMEPGAYSLTVLTRRANSKVAYDSFVKTEAFWVKNDVAVESIAPVADITVNEGEKVTLPENVTLNMSDKTTKEAKVTWAAVDTAKPGEYTVEGTVEGTDKKATVKVVVKEVAFGVESVSAINLKTVTVTFNKAIDDETVTATTVKLTKGTTDVVNSRTVSEDKKSMVIELKAGVVQSDELKLAVNGVKTADAKEIKNYTNTFVINDTTIPSAMGAAALNAKQVEVYFNEPINYSKSSFQVLNNVKIDGIVAIAKATPNNVKNSVVFEVPTALTAGQHTIEVADMVDYATYKAVKASFNFAVAEDKTAPVLVKAEVKNKTTLEVTFDETVAVAGTISVNGDEATVTPVANTNNTKFTLTDCGTLDLSAIVEIRVAYVGQADIVGNKVEKEVTYKFNVADDTVLPTVSAAIDSANKLTLTFSKTMDTTAGTITIKNEDGTVIKAISQPFTFKANTNNTVLELLADATDLDDMDPANVIINVKGMKDATIRANLLPETNVTLKINDSKLPTVEANYFRQAGATTKEDTITFYFSEAMDTATLRNLSNYVGSSFNALSSVDGAEVKSIGADGKSITITVPGISATEKDAETFTIYALKDVNGNMIVTKTGIAKLPSTELTFTSAEATSTNTIKVVFNTRLATVDPSALKIVLASGSTDEAVFINAVIDANDATGKTVIFTTNKALGTDLKKYNVIENNVNAIKNIYDVALTAPGAKTITDSVAPTVKVATGDVAKEIKITFSEAVGGATFSEALLNGDLIVRDKNGDIVAPTFTYKLGTEASTVNAATGFDTIVIGGLNSGETYTVQLIARSLKDLADTPVVITGVPTTSVVAK